jgi:MFS transporter, MHS family, proline/betaine transporter
MHKQQNISKVTSLIILGNILEYYDFLLFAHLGVIITPLFFPDLSSTQTHILSLALFGLSFIMRPVGGFIFGKISDTFGRKLALVQSVKWAIFPTIGLAFLPSFEIIGIFGTYMFIALRLFQGIALGGEYPAAGTYMMEMRKNKHGFFSSIMVASGSVGSFIGLCFALICMQPESPPWLWRIAFLLGGVGAILSFFLRKNLVEYTPKTMVSLKVPENMNMRRLAVFMISILVSTSVWIPMTYSNFYVTKVLNYSNDLGLYASFIGLITFILVLPIAGFICDKLNRKKYITYISLLVSPITIGSIYLLTQGYITLAQLGLAFSAAFFAAPSHALANSLFHPSMRGKNVGFFLMLGASFGGIFPSISSYIVAQTRWDLAPAFLISVIAITTYFCLRNQDFDNELAE